MLEVVLGMIIPFMGTVVGSALVFFMNGKLSEKLEKLLLGFSAGVMVAASIWSLLIPAIEQGSRLGVWSFVPALIGLVLGFCALLMFDVFIEKCERKTENTKTDKMFFAMTLHNIPEGLAVGVAIAGFFYGDIGLSFASVITLSIGIAVQNIPEGAIVSMPLRNLGHLKRKAFFKGVVSGIVEPISAVVAFLITGVVRSILPYILALAAGSMLYVVVTELVPESQEGGFSKVATLGFVLGFVLMMTLDVALA